MDERAEQALIVERINSFQSFAIPAPPKIAVKMEAGVIRKKRPGNELKTNAGSLPERDGCASIATPIICGT